jgi:hypothetical protein
MNRHLMEAIIQYAAFLELSGDEVINPDAAVRELESLASTLASLSQQERKIFIDFTTQYADKEQRGNQPMKRVKFIRSIPESLGLTE